MQGQVRQLGGLEGGGLILGDDGNRYSFTLSQWKGGQVPVVGTTVEFAARDGAAEDIQPLPNLPPPVEIPASEIPPSDDSMMATVAIGLLALGFVIPILPTIAALIIGLLESSSAKRSGRRTALIFSRIAWIGAVIMLILAAVFLTIAFDVVKDFLTTIFRLASGTKA